MAFDAPLPSLPKANISAEALSIFTKLLKAQPPAVPIPGPSGFVPGCDCSQCNALRAFVAPHPPTREDNIRDLKKARERIARGWCQGTTLDPSGNVCAMGGIIYAVTGNENLSGGDIISERRADDLARLLPGMAGAGTVIKFNDATSTTKRDVLGLFDRAIMRLEGQSLPPSMRPFALPRFMQFDL